MTSTSDPQAGTCKSMVTQMYTFSSWSKHKSVENGHGSSSMLPYVGFPGLSLTPIPESPLTDSVLNEDADLGERDRWLQGDSHHEDSRRHCRPQQHNGSLPRHWKGRGVARPSPSIEESVEVELSKDRDCGETDPKASSRTCSVNVHVVQTTTFLPKEECMTREEKRAHLCKLLLFALCGFVIVAGIVLWIFSPTFT